MTRVLVVDDEPALRDAVSYALESEGFEVRTAADGEEALAEARGDVYDLMILDLRLPRVSGLDVCKRLRGESPIPIIILTAKDSEVDHVLGLEIGADDYVTKPFSMAELLSRVRALLRRRELDRSGEPSSVYEAGDVRVDLVQHEVRVAGERVRLTPSEFRLVALLASEPGRAYSRRELLEHLWQSTFVADERACDVHVANVRRKIERDPAHPERLLTVRGVGYRLAA